MVVYVLQLDNDKYYVGKTDDVDRRIKEHIDGHGSEWTHIHRYVNLLRTIRQDSGFTEDFTTIEMMKQYGIENVRGGSFCQVVLPDYQLKTLDYLFKSAEGQCFYCSSTFHCINKCPTKLYDDYTAKHKIVDELESEKDGLWTRNIKVEIHKCDSEVTWRHPSLD